AEAHHARRLAAVQAQHQEALEAAYRNGYNDGVAMAQADHEEERQRQSALIAALTEEFARTRREWFTASEQQMVELIACALEQILGDRPSKSEHVLHALRQAIAQLDEGDRATVRCHPDDLPFVRAACEQQPDLLRGAQHIRLTADDAIQPGGCLVETDLGVVDARVEQQLRILRGALKDVAGDIDSQSSAPVVTMDVPAAMA
ncbi:MAG TPA: FliH/SctL family protein, partial [Acidobacteriota bacterium]|nr:FliH/SctL family protein [Acidobacteriota bacterium]